MYIITIYYNCIYIYVIDIYLASIPCYPLTPR